MRKIYSLALIVIVAVAMASCNIGGQPSFQMEDLYGYWLEDNTQHYVRFTMEESDELPFLYGYEWDEADEMTEVDVLAEREEIGKPGNGWFKYWMEEKGDLHEIHLMSNEGADIPKEYIVTVLSGTNLSYYEKDNKNIKFQFTKVVKTAQSTD